MQAVVTEGGRIETELVVNACGMWAPQVAAMVGAFAPSVPVDHQHIALHAVPGHELDREMPCFRDTDNLVYGRSEAGGVLFGGYEPNPVARWVDGVPWDHAGRTLPADHERFAQLMEGAARRFPFLDDAGVVALVCHPDAMTPDGNPLLGPMPGVPGFWMAAGLSLNGFGGAGGIGKTIAEWITAGETELDVHGYRAWRFGAAHRHPDALEAAGRETYKYYYRLRYPLDTAEWGRPGRVSPLHGRTQDLGAVFGCKNGWERPDFYRPGRPWRRAGADQREYGWTRPPEFERLAAEHTALRERVGIIDMTSFGKIEVEGPDAAALLDRVCVNRVDRPPGSVVYTQWCDRRGGIVADVTVTRLADERFRVVTGAGVVDSDLGWLRLHRRDGEAVSLRECSDELAVIGMWGPRAREVLAAVTAADVGAAALPFRAAATIAVGPRSRAGPADHLRRRAGLRALRRARVGRAGVGRAARGRGGARHRAGRVPRARVAADGEGLPLHGHRHLGGRHAVRGRPGLLRRARQGRLHRPRGARGRRGARCAAGAADARRRRRGVPAAVRRRGGAARRAHRRARAQLRLRPHGAPQHRLRLPARRTPAPARRSKSRCSGSRSRPRWPPTCSTTPPTSGCGPGAG